MKRFWPYFLMTALLVVFMIPVEVDAQCAMCRATAETNAQSGDSGVGNLNSGILYLMAIPYILLFFFLRKRIVKFFREMGSIYK